MGGARKVKGGREEPQASSLEALGVGSLYKMLSLRCRECPFCLALRYDASREAAKRRQSVDGADSSKRWKEDTQYPHLPSCAFVQACSGFVPPPAVVPCIYSLIQQGPPKVSARQNRHCLVRLSHPGASHHTTGAVPHSTDLYEKKLSQLTGKL